MRKGPPGLGALAPVWIGILQAGRPGGGISRTTPAGEQAVGSAPGAPCLPSRVTPEGQALPLVPSSGKRQVLGGWAGGRGSGLGRGGPDGKGGMGMLLAANTGCHLGLGPGGHRRPPTRGGVTGPAPPAPAGSGASEPPSTPPDRAPPSGLALVTPRASTPTGAQTQQLRGERARLGWGWGLGTNPPLRQAPWGTPGVRPTLLYPACGPAPLTWALPPAC